MTILINRRSAFIGIASTAMTLKRDAFAQLMPSTQTAHPLHHQFSNPAAPSDPAMRALAQDILQELKYAFALRAANSATPPRNEIERTMGNYLRTRPAEARANLGRRSTELLDAPLAVQKSEFGRHIPGTGAPLRPAPYNPSDLANAIRQALAKKEKAEHKQKVQEELKKYDETEGQKYKRLVLYCDQIRCIKTTSGWGDDSIAIGGIKISPDGTSSKIAESREWTFNETDKNKKIRNFAGGYKFAEWNIQTGTGLPVGYGVITAMVEKDSGGFSDFLNSLWSITREKIEGAISAGLTSSLVSLGLPPEVAKAIGDAVAWIVGKFVDWLIGGLKDDLIQVRHSTLILESALMSYYYSRGLFGLLTHAENYKPAIETASYKGDGGHYEISWRYQVFA